MGDLEQRVAAELRRTRLHGNDAQARAVIPIIRDEERAQIVAWLRSKEAARIACSHYAYMNDLADAIEAGEHGKESGVPLK